MCTEAYFKELAHTIVEAGKSTIWRAGRQARDLGKSWCCSSRPKAGWRSPSSSGTSVCFLFGSSTDWLHEAHPHDGGQSALLRVHGFKCSSHLKMTFVATSRLACDQIAGFHGPAVLTHAISPHTISQGFSEARLLKSQELKARRGESAVLELFSCFSLSLLFYFLNFLFLPSLLPFASFWHVPSFSHPLHLRRGPCAKKE